MSDSITRNESIQLTRQDLQNLVQRLEEADEHRNAANIALGEISREHYKLEQLLLGLQKRFE